MEPDNINILSDNRKLLSDLLIQCERKKVSSTYIYDFLKECTNGFSNSLVITAIDETRVYFEKVVKEFILYSYSYSSSSSYKSELDNYFSGELENDFYAYLNSGLINANNKELIPFLDKFLGFKTILSILRSNNKSISTEQVSAETNPIKGAKYAIDNSKDNNYIDIEILKEYFDPQFKQCNNSIRSDFDSFVNDLRSGLPSYTQNDITAIASIVYRSGKIHRSKKNNTFSGWLNEFSAIINRKTPTSKEGQLTSLIADLSKRFYYFSKLT